MKKVWHGFNGGTWQSSINVRDFIQTNYKPYERDEGFLRGATQRTEELNKKLNVLFSEEQKRGGVLDIDTETVTSLTSYKAGYLDKEKELIVGLQTNSPLCRGINPFGGINMTRNACKAYGYELSDKVEQEFLYRTTHNDGVFRVYTDEIKAARRCGVITGLPDAYGRGRIIGDYRRVALYGVDYLIKCKEEDKRLAGENIMLEDNIRLLEELFRQIDFLKKLKEMAEIYGLDISWPAKNAHEAVQWIYFAYLGAIKEQNGAAMSLGRVSTFLDIYFERDIAQGILTETDAQELMDDFVMKLRMARHLRTPEYNELFAGDPMWITEALGGMGEDGRTLVTKNTYRMLNTLYNLGSLAEPNMTVLWSENLPEPFKRFVAKISCDTDAIQYENDDLMRPSGFGDDYAIACCVSAMRIGKDMQLFGARANLGKMLLMSLNGGKDEKTGVQVAPYAPPYSGDILQYEKVLELLDFYRAWLAKTYVSAMNIIHYMHDKYAYEKVQMALHDTDVHRFMAFGAAGMSVLADSLSAIKYAKVKVIRNEAGLITDFITEGDFPTFGNDDDRVDTIATQQIELFMNELRKKRTYKNAEHTLSILTITSNVVYGKKTGATPDGRKAGEPFAPGANPMHNREKNGALASMNSVAKISYDTCRDGISNTFSIIPEALGHSDEERYENLAGIIDGYFSQKAHHLNVNVINREMLIDAMDYPEKYPNLTIRVSGYAVNFHKLQKEQQREVISRTFHSFM
ncbi:MAG: formate C-acetyltransferase [Eubacteriales bacterium]|nr:formate C-acetyltransferase [Eubacteriales bacterium]